MKLLLAALLVAAPGLFAQARGGGGRSGGGMRGPVRVASPALGARPIGPVIAPYPAYFGGYYNPYYGGYATEPAPVDPGYYGYDPSQGYAPQGNPSVLINPNYTPETANPVLRVYTNSTVPEAVPQQGADPQTGVNQIGAASTPSVFFLIAMKDHAIYPAIAYWVEDGILNYISQQGVRNRVSLDLVDLAFSTQLNKERNIDFGLPPSK
jgi:hypothetical protein